MPEINCLVLMKISLWLRLRQLYKCVSSNFNFILNITAQSVELLIYMWAHHIHGYTSGVFTTYNTDFEEKFFN
jgi:hypothetical protein